MKKIILSFFIALFMFGSIPAISFATTGEQIPVGMLAQLLAAIQTLVEKVSDLQKVTNNAGSTSVNVETSPTTPSTPIVPITKVNTQNDELLSTCCGCYEFVMGAPGNMVASGPCSTLRCQPGYIKDTASQSICFANGGTPSNSPINGTNTQGTKSLSISTSTPTQSFITIAKDVTAPSSRITIANQEGVELHKIRFEGRGSDATLKKITLQFVRASKRLWTLSEVAANFSTISLYDGSTLVGQGTVDASKGTVVFSGINVLLPKDTQKVLTVKADIAPSGTIKDNSVLAFQVYSNKPNDLEIYDVNGLLNQRFITLNNTESSFNLYKSAAPAITNSLNNSMKIPQNNDVISKFKIANTVPVGGRSLSLSSFNVQAMLGGNYVPQSTVTSFKLYDDEDMLIATAGGTRVLTGTTPSVLIKFVPQSNMIQEIAAGSSKTYIIKADTSNIRNAIPSGSTVLLWTKILGAKGYKSTDFVGPEYYWNTGNVGYEYTPVGGKKIKGNTASDSYQVDGATLTY